MKPASRRALPGWIALLPACALAGTAAYLACRNLIRHVYPEFVDLPAALSTTLAVVLAIVFYCLILGAGSGPAAGVQSGRPLYWLGGAAAALAACLAMVWGVDPHGHFGSSWFPPMILSARGEKVEAYASLDQPPGLVVMGSSNTFTISPSYLKQQLGLSAFNFGVEAGQIEDALLEARFIHQLDRAEAPAVFLVEVEEPLRDGELTAAKRASVVQWRFMEAATLWLTLQQQFRETLNIQSLADATYGLLFYTRGKDPPMEWRFQEDGMGIYQQGAMPSDAMVTGAVQRDIRDLPAAQCSSLDPLSQAKVLELVTLAESRGIALVFFRGPVHPEYYQAILAGNPEFQTCHARLVEFFQELQAQHAGVRFVDLLGDPSITALGNEGFFDSHHLSPAGAELLVDALAPALRSAISP